MNQLGISYARNMNYLTNSLFLLINIWLYGLENQKPKNPNRTIRSNDWTFKLRSRPPISAIDNSVPVLTSCFAQKPWLRTRFEGNNEVIDSRLILWARFMTLTATLVRWQETLFYLSLSLSAGVNCRSNTDTWKTRYANFRRKKISLQNPVKVKTCPMKLPRNYFTKTSTR